MTTPLANPVIGNMTQLSYDAVEDKGRRQAPRTRTRHEDRVLTPQKRRRLTATTRDVRRNYAVAAWMVRKHLDYVSSFKFQAKTGDKELDDQIEGLMTWWGNRRNCDYARRHPLRRLIRLAEAHRTVDGDFFFYRLANGALQGIESDRVCNCTTGAPRGVNVSEFYHGIKRRSSSGEALRYMLCDRDESGAAKVYKAIVPARQIFSLGYYDRIDQVRGISPIAAALNTLTDTYEGFDYALAKMKVAQMFGLVFSRDASEPLGDITHTGGEDEDGDETKGGYNVDFGRGPVQLDLDAGDKADFIESKTPASETQAFLEMMIHVSLKALDLPYSFFNESFTNFYGSRGGMIQYLKSCKTKQLDIVEVLDEITAWRLGLFIEDGLLVLPAGVELSQVRWEWIPDGVPWWDAAKEVRGHRAAIESGLDNPVAIARAAGSDVYDNIDRTAEVIEYAREKGVPLSFDQMAPEPAATTTDNETTGTDDAN